MVGLCATMGWVTFVVLAPALIFESNFSRSRDSKLKITRWMDTSLFSNNDWAYYYNTWDPTSYLFDVS
jgi:hypothetical protein